MTAPSATATTSSRRSDPSSTRSISARAGAARTSSTSRRRRSARASPPWSPEVVQQFRVDRRVDAFCLLIEPDFVREAGAVLSPMLAEPGFALGDARDGTRDELLALADQLAAEQARPLDAHQPALMEALLRAVLLRLERLVHAGTPPVPELARFFTILERDFARTRAVAHYAKQAGLSPRRLGELLVAQAGKSTKQVIDDRVLLEHKRLLAHTQLSVKELAERTGFDEPTNLVKFFRQRTGQTPLEFRAGSTFLPSRRRS